MAVDIDLVELEGGAGTSRPKHLFRLVAQAASDARVESHSGHSQ
jgi:hypothetical protein